MYIYIYAQSSEFFNFAGTQDAEDFMAFLLLLFILFLFVRSQVSDVGGAQSLSRGNPVMSLNRAR